MKESVERLYKSLLVYRFTDAEAEMLIERILQRADSGYHSEPEILRRAIEAFKLQSK